MTLGEICAPLTAIFRMILSLVGHKNHQPYKKLNASLIMRGIVAEVPNDVPFYLCSEDGDRHKGIYIIGLLIWNKGNQPITQADMIASAPLQVTIGNDAKLITTKVIPVEEQTQCGTLIVSPHRLHISFDCINPGEYLVVPIFVTGNPATEIIITGRIIGQDSPIDHTAEEVKAGFFERFTAVMVLLLTINALPGFFIGGWFILKNYGISVLLNQAHMIPAYIILPFSMGLLILSLFFLSRITYWLERRAFPKGYPLESDLEPPLKENIQGMLKTIFLGRKQRLSLSLFNWGKPVMMSNRKVKKRSVDDWIQ